MIPKSLSALALGAGLLLAGCGGDPASTAAPTQTAAGGYRVKDPNPPVFAAGPPGIGYQARACGFDLDDDGAVGESEDCRVCNGRDQDPDGDGQAEDLIYVAAGEGRDQRGCGSPTEPCATLLYAFTQVADGTLDGAEDIVCLAGRTAEESLKPPLSGLDGHLEVPASGMQGRSFVRRRDPAMLVGWDRDGDGAYPPFDRDDVAVVDGQGKSRALLLDALNDGLEIAHLTFEAFGKDSTLKSSGFVKLGGSPGELESVFFHDLHLIDINRGRATASEIATFDLFLGKTRLRHLEVSNVWAPRGGGFFARGAADSGPDAGPYRFQAISHTAEACDFAECQQGATAIGFHLWGALSGIEVLDSHFDANVKGWEPKPKGGPTGAGFVTAAQCSQDWLIRNNLVVDHKVFAKLQGWAEGYCDKGNARPVDRVVIDKNTLRNGYEPWNGGDLPIYVAEGGPNAGEVVGDVRVTNNVFTSTTGYEACFWLRGGNGAQTPPGHIVFANNTCAINVNRHGALVIGNAEGEDLAFPHQRLVVVNNVFTGLDAKDANAVTFYAPAEARVDHNVWDPAALFVGHGEKIPTLAGWREKTGWDAASEACAPSFVEIERQDLHLRAGDTCAAGRGGEVQAPPDLAELSKLDRDGKPRNGSAGAY